MRVAFVNQPWSVCPPDNSADSIALVTYHLARELTRYAKVRCYGRRLTGRLQNEVLDDVEYRRIRAPIDRVFNGLRLLDKWRLTPVGKPFHQWPLYHIAYAVGVARDLRASPCDVVHIHNFAQCARIVRLLNPKVRVVLHMHCDWLRQLDKKMVRRSLQNVDLVLGVSRFITQNARQRFFLERTPFRTLYNGVQFERFANTDGSIRNDRSILFVGRLSPEKGAHVLLQAFVQIAAQFPDVTLTLIGPDSVLSREFVDPRDEDAELKRLARFFADKTSYASHLRTLIPSDLSSRVRFLGVRAYDELPKHYASAGMLVVSSVFDEPFGLPLAEAMAAGVPCIATHAGAFPEIVEDQRTGMLVPRADVNALAGAMRTLLLNSARPGRWG